MKIFVNTLARFSDRKARIKDQLDALSLPFEFFEGTDSRNLTKAQLNDAYDEARTKRNLNRAMSLSEIACTMAHRDIYKKMIDENIEKALILEDDILLDSDLPEVLAFLERLEFVNTAVKLDNYREKATPCSVWNRRRINHRVVYKKPVTTQWMTWGYVIDQVAASSILREWKKIEFVCDDWKRMSTVVKIRCVQPAVVHDNLAIASNLAEGRKELAAGSERQIGSLHATFKRIPYIVKTVMRMLFP